MAEERFQAAAQAGVDARKHGAGQNSPERRFFAFPRDLRAYILSRVGKDSGFISLLMKQRNGEPWTAEDRARLHARLRRFAHLSPYLVILLLPGSILLLPAYAWWLDRRRKRRAVRRSVPVTPD